MAAGLVRNPESWRRNICTQQDRVRLWAALAGYWRTTEPPSGVVERRRASVNA